MAAVTAAPVMEHQHRLSTFPPRQAIGPSLDFVAWGCLHGRLLEMMKQRIHCRRRLQVATPVEGGIEARRGRAACPPAQKRIVEQRGPRHAPSLRFVIELAEVEFRVESAFEHGQPPRHEMEHGGR